MHTIRQFTGIVKGEIGLEAQVTATGIPNSLGEVTVETAIATVEDNLGGYYIIFTRRKTTTGVWLDWSENTIEPNKENPIELKEPKNAL